MSNFDLELLQKQIEVHLNNYANQIIPVVKTEIQGFGLARLKEEGQIHRYDKQANLYFPNDGFYLTGKLTKAKVNRLLKKAYEYIWNSAGYNKWKYIAWRAIPTFIQEKDFENNAIYTKLIFRCVFLDD